MDAHRLLLVEAAACGGCCLLKSLSAWVQGAEEVYGANRWDTAKFASEADKQKFIKLMGAQSGPQPAAAAELEDVDERDHHREVLTGWWSVYVLGVIQGRLRLATVCLDGCGAQFPN